MRGSIRVAALGLAASFATLSGTALAQSADDWMFHAFIYGYLPDIHGSTSFPNGRGDSINVDAADIIHHLKFTFMGTLEAQKGPFGFVTDVVYVDVGGSKSQTHNLSVDGQELPIGATANADLSIKAVLWTLAGEYSVVADPTTAVDLLAGARLLDLKETLTYTLSTDIGPFVGPGRSGSSKVNTSYWDGIVGAKGRFLFGDNREWFAPWYADVGTGQSRLTWQVVGGIGYQLSWGQLLATWRYIDYRFKSGSAAADLSMNGPMFGVAFNW
jgi:hypothetical protein